MAASQMAAIFFCQKYLNAQRLHRDDAYCASTQMPNAAIDYGDRAGQTASAVTSFHRCAAEISYRCGIV